MTDRTANFIQDAGLPAPDPLPDALRLIASLRNGVRKAVKPMEVLCCRSECSEWARFRSDTEDLLCPAHAREAQTVNAAKLWHFAQPKIVYDLHALLMRHTPTELAERRASLEARIKTGTLRGTSLERMEYEMGRDLRVEPETTDTKVAGEAAS